MNNKHYKNILEKIKILKNVGHNEKLENFEQKFLLESIRFYGKNDSEIEHYISSHQFINQLNNIAEGYNQKIKDDYYKIETKININVREQSCKNCNIPLIKRSSRLICDNCGFNELIQQIYYGELYIRKTKKYKDNNDSYCLEWLNYLQGKGAFILPTEIFQNLIEIAKNYINNNVKIINNIKCKNIRYWLSIIKATKYNKYVPIIHRRLTRELGFEIIPPQFTLDEEQIIISDWRYLSPTYCEEYCKLKQKTNKKRNNNPYYPICIYFIVKTRFGEERGRILEPYIHKQSMNTYFLRELSWFNTIERLGYTGIGKYN